ncbi:MAG: CDGSH iron-sulfur domain-containing protein [Paludibacter sp.]|nr:CDGSH iron-sulfur domain-containing protein [Paludibacter sp.]
MENMNNEIKVYKGGPYLFTGEFKIVMPSGEVKMVKDPHLCRCGLSKNKPFCDGSHAKSDFDK